MRRIPQSVSKEIMIICSHIEVYLNPFKMKNNCISRLSAEIYDHPFFVVIKHIDIHIE